MDHTEPREVVHSWFERVWNQGDLTAIDEMFPADGIAHGLSGDAERPVRGPARFKEFAQTLRGAVPDIHVEALRYVTQGPFCAAYCRVTGTHRGDTLGVSATGRAIEFQGMTMVRVENGRIMEAWNFFDFLSFYQQIGALPPLPGQK